MPTAPVSVQIRSEFEANASGTECKSSAFCLGVPMLSNISLPLVRSKPNFLSKAKTMNSQIPFFCKNVEHRILCSARNTETSI